ncbi:MAG: TetR family transcriptional regulator [Pseudomonadales bacterium]|nr:TetR family transcriptional regulator [Pseudomonadales bacterium]
MPRQKNLSKTQSVPATEPVQREARGERRKRMTREKLMGAAFRLMAERGMDAVAINDITEAADVGFGTFYNHFESKETIYEAVMDGLFEDFADALERITSGVEDPAEVISICFRHSILRARREPLWGQFLVREGYSARALTRGLGARLLRDIQIGIAQGRFSVPDPFMTFITVGSTILGAISADIEDARDQTGFLQQIGFSTDDFPERAATIVLYNLGLPREEAHHIAQLPLPVADPS